MQLLCDEKESELFFSPSFLLLPQMTQERLGAELTAKSSRLGSDLLRWAFYIVFAVVFLEETPYLPSLVLTLLWLLTWALKGIWDVAEDVAPSLKENRVLRILCLVGGCALGYFLPTQSVVLWMCFAAMLVGSLVAGGVDSKQWAVAAVATSIGLIRGYAIWHQVIWREWPVMLAGALSHALFDGLIDRFNFEGIIFRLKVLPTALSGVVLLLLGGEEAVVSRAIFHFLLLSPHFVVYDAAKSLLCWSLLPDADDVAGPLGHTLRGSLLRLAAFWGSKGIDTRVISEPSLCCRVLKSSETKGIGMEYFVSRKAWGQVIPTESIDGPQVFQLLFPPFFFFF